jgi:hypothetical protein
MVLLVLGSASLVQRQQAESSERAFSFFLFSISRIPRKASLWVEGLFGRK